LERDAEAGGFGEIPPVQRRAIETVIANRFAPDRSLNTGYNRYFDTSRPSMGGNEGTRLLGIFIRLSMKDKN
jgi:hypothetical protein